MLSFAFSLSPPPRLFACFICPQNLFQKDVFTTVGWIPPASSMSAFEEIFNVARAQALIALGSTIPGYWFTVFTVDRLGRWWIQMMGFFFMTLWMGVLVASYDKLLMKNVNGFVVLYALTFFFANWGPNSTTFIIPSELFAARFRATCHGLSAAAGKAGAIIGAFGFLYASQPTPTDTDPTRCVAGVCPHKMTDPGGFDSNGNALPRYPTGIGLRGALGLLVAVNFLGMLCTFFVPETSGLSLEELSGETSGPDAQRQRPPDAETPAARGEEADRLGVGLAAGPVRVLIQQQRPRARASSLDLGSIAASAVINVRSFSGAFPGGINR